MRTFFLIVKSIVFLIVFLFSLNNTHITTINIFPGFSDIAIDAPLIIWLLLFFFLGVVLTVILFLPTVLKNTKSKKSNVS